MTTDLLFVYGTLRSGSGHPMHDTLAQGAESLGDAVFRGRLYRVSHYPGAVPSRHTIDRVHGEVYRLRAPAQLLAIIDAYESRAFERCAMRVALAAGSIVTAWIYVYRQSTRGLERIRSGDFLDAEAPAARDPEPRSSQDRTR